jgi:hypothetical protein
MGDRTASNSFADSAWWIQPSDGTGKASVQVIGYSRCPWTVHGSRIFVDHPWTAILCTRPETSNPLSNPSILHGLSVPSQMLMIEFNTQRAFNRSLLKPHTKIESAH